MKEYPENYRFVVMTLIREMKRPRQAWADIMLMADALSNIQLQAEQMRKERNDGLKEEPTGGNIIGTKLVHYSLNLESGNTAI